MIHAKIMVVDGLWSVVGSTNLDARSFALNDEVNLAALNPQLSQELTMEFDLDRQKAKRITYEDWKKRPVWERFVEALGYFIEREQ